MYDNKVYKMLVPGHRVGPKSVGSNIIPPEKLRFLNILISDERSVLWVKLNLEVINPTWK